MLQPLRQPPDDLRARGTRQLFQFVERLVNRPGRVARIGGQQKRSLVLPLARPSSGPAWQHGRQRSFGRMIALERVSPRDQPGRATPD